MAWGVREVVRMAIVDWGVESGGEECDGDGEVEEKWQ